MYTHIINKATHVRASEGRNDWLLFFLPDQHFSRANVIDLFFSTLFLSLSLSNGNSKDMSRSGKPPSGSFFSISGATNLDTSSFIFYSFNNSRNFLPNSDQHFPSFSILFFGCCDLQFFRQKSALCFFFCVPNSNLLLVEIREQQVRNKTLELLGKWKPKPKATHSFDLFFCPCEHKETNMQSIRSLLF